MKRDCYNRSFYLKKKYNDRYLMECNRCLNDYLFFFSCFSCYFSHYRKKNILLHTKVVFSSYSCFAIKKKNK